LFLLKEASIIFGSILTTSPWIHLESDYHTVPPPKERREKEYGAQQKISKEDLQSNSPGKVQRRYPCTVV
jgi:hypothetical protein